MKFHEISDMSQETNAYILEVIWIAIWIQENFYWYFEISVICTYSAFDVVAMWCHTIYDVTNQIRFSLYDWLVLQVWQNMHV